MTFNPVRLALRVVGRPLVRNDVAQGVADALVIIVSDPLPRARHAAQLFHKGRAPRIMIVKTRGDEIERLGLVPNEAEVTKAYLGHLGVPPEAVTIVEEGDDETTFSEAKSHRDYLLANPPGASRLVVVTSWYHSRRAGRIFETVFKDLGTAIEVAAAPHPKSSAENWWEYRASILNVFLEYTKWVYLFSKGKVL